MGQQHVGGRKFKFVLGLQHVEEPDWVGVFLGVELLLKKRIAFVEMAFTVFWGGQESRRLALG